MKKFKVLLLVIVGLLLILPFSTHAERNLGNEEGEFTQIRGKMYEAFEGDGYFGLAPGHYYVKWLQDSGGNSSPWIAYCTDFEMQYFYRTDFASQGAADVGIQYIIKNGFVGDPTGAQSYHYSTNNDCESDDCPSLLALTSNAPKANSPWYVNYWLTQVAIWVYQGTVDGFTGDNLTENQRIVMNLVNKAREEKEKADNFTTVNPSMSIGNSELKLDGNYYYSELITPSGVGEKYTVEVNNNNYEVVDSNKNAKTTFNTNEKFYIRVLKSKVTKSEEVTVTLTTNGKTYANKYVSAEGSQDLASYKVTEDKSKTATLKLNVNYICDLTITVIDSVTKEKICGGSFNVLDENGKGAKNINGEDIGTITLSGDKCTATISVPYGKYTVVQQTAVEPYIKDETKHQVNTETECPLTVELVNEKLYQIKILKVDGSETNPLAGAKLKLVDSNNKVIKEFVSTKEAIVIDKLPAGTYYLTEVESPKGYNLNNEKMTIVVNDNSNNKQFLFYNDESLYKIRILKVDGDETNPLEGAKLKLQDVNGKVVKEFVSTKEAIVIDNLHAGTYYLTEVEAPKGYVLSEETITIEVNSDNNDKLIVFNNDEQLYKVRILKINGSETNPLEGAMLKLVDSNGKVIKEFVSTKEEIVIENLHEGTYYLTEEAAPSGYKLSSEKITIVVNAKNDNKLYTFNNDEIVVPKTDFDTNFIVFGIILGAIGVGFIIYSKKRYA